MEKWLRNSCLPAASRSWAGKHRLRVRTGLECPEDNLKELMQLYFGHLMWRTDSLKKTLMLGKIEGRRRRRRQLMRWLDGITDSMNIWTLSIEILETRREWQNILKVMKEKNLQPRLLCPARISIRFEGEIKNFTNEQKLREFSATKPTLQQMVKNLL